MFQAFFVFSFIIDFCFKLSWEIVLTCLLAFVLIKPKGKVL